MVEGKLSRQKLPEDESVREHVCFHRVVSALCENLWCHPPQVLRGKLLGKYFRGNENPYKQIEIAI